MKAAVFLFLLAVSSVVMRAQSGAAPSTDVTIGISEGTPEYCLGPYGATLSKASPGDITLRLPLKLRYENHQSVAVLLPSQYQFVMRVTMAGRNGSIIERRGGGGPMDVNEVMAMPRPDAPKQGSQFSILPGKRPAT